MPIQPYEEKKANLLAQLEAQRKEGREIGLSKGTSNLFRRRSATAGGKLDARRFDQVLSVDGDARVAEAEGMISYEALVDVTLQAGLLPAVVPELKSITLGGAISGGGIESSSFRYGFVHETVLEMEILLADGRIVTCAPGNEHRDLFYGIPNSYGTLGYILKARILLIEAKKYVKLTRWSYTDPEKYFSALKERCLRSREKASTVAYIDGTVFSHEEMVFTVGEFTDEAPFVSNYKKKHIYYKSIPRKKTDYLETSDYIWRWDTDWFWCARAFGMENRAVRFLFGSLGLLRSTTYWKLRKWVSEYGILKIMERNNPREYVIQDVEVPVEGAEEFLRFFQKKIGIKPIWVCPVMARDKDDDFFLYRTNPGILYINFGFWGGVKSTQPEGHYNRMIERKVQALCGKKSLYSTSFFPEDEFWKIYNKPDYDRLKEKYDPKGVFRNLYEKCVQRR